MYIISNLRTSILVVIREIFIWIDSIGLTFIDDAYNLLISAISAFDETAIDSIVSNITHNCYIIIGIFALFRIALLLVNSIINPDKLTEQKSGFGNMLANLVITIVLLVATPFIFDLSRELQGEIIDNNYISKLLIGQNLTSASSSTSNPGTLMKDIAVRSLIYPDDTIAIKEGNTYVAKTGGVCDTDCEAAIQAWNNDVSITTLKNFIATYTSSGDNDVFIYHYYPFITLIVGGFITYVLLSFAIDIAVRSVELVVLEILSPLFIVTYIDPKSATSGPFKRWLSTCGKTYVSLFIKIAIVCLMLLFVSNLNSILVAATDSTGLLQLIMLLAILIFAKKAPKWIGDMLGVEGGLGGLGIGKKLAGAALVGGFINKGLDASKKFVGQKANQKLKRTGARVVNRLGADVGGTIDGRKAAKQNALGDKSLRQIKENQGIKGAFKSVFSKDDINERRERLKEARDKGELKSGSKQGRLDARVRATQAALDGKFKFAPELGREVRQTYDPNYKTNDERRLDKVQNKAQSYQGFDLPSINKQKDAMEKAHLATMMTGRRCIVGDDGKTILDSTTGLPATFNGKTLKVNYGTTVSSYEDMAAIKLGGASAFITPREIKLSDGTIASAGSAVTKDEDGKYTQVADSTKVSETADQIKYSYSSYGQKEMEALFAERKAENASSFIQTTQLLTQAQQDATKLQLDLSPLTDQLLKLRKVGNDMTEKLETLQKQKNTETNLEKRAELSEQIEGLEASIAANKAEQAAIEIRKKPVEDALKRQTTFIEDLEDQSKKYNNPENPICLEDGTILNIANASEVQARLNKDKEDKRKEADAAIPSFKSSGNDNN